jgi:hypothetical protein
VGLALARRHGILRLPQRLLTKILSLQFCRGVDFLKLIYE